MPYHWLIVSYIIWCDWKSRNMKLVVTNRCFFLCVFWKYYINIFLMSFNSALIWCIICWFFKRKKIPKFCMVILTAWHFLKCNRWILQNFDFEMLLFCFRKKWLPHKFEDLDKYPLSLIYDFRLLMIFGRNLYWKLH